LWAVLPVYGTVLIFTSMASLGLPGLNGFVSEFMVVRGAWPVFMLATAVEHDWAVVHRRVYAQGAA
jgi:NADH-quinone oxidoreductase subunit M